MYGAEGSGGIQAPQIHSSHAAQSSSPARSSFPRFLRGIPLLALARGPRFDRVRKAIAWLAGKTGANFNTGTGEELEDWEESKLVPPESELTESQG